MWTCTLSINEFIFTGDETAPVKINCFTTDLGLQVQMKHIPHIAHLKLNFNAAFMEILKTSEKQMRSICSITLWAALQWFYIHCKRFARRPQPIDNAPVPPPSHRSMLDDLKFALNYKNISLWRHCQWCQNTCSAHRYINVAARKRFFNLMFLFIFHQLRTKKLGMSVPQGAGLMNA